LKITYYPAKENRMFPPEITALIRFVRPDAKMECPECHKKTKRLWTMLCPFRATTLKGFALSDGEERPAGTPVCDDHPLAPDLAEELIGCGTIDT
jgi:hypothetical protein